MNKVRQIQQLNKRELEAGISTSASWHADYRDTAYIYIGGLPLDLSEGDVVTIFSQFGEPVFINLVRDKETGRSKGFCFLKYEDQRSTDLAVDNLSGAKLMGRVLSIDHTRYQKRDDEEIYDNTSGPKTAEQRRLEAATEEEQAGDKSPERPLLKEERELAILLRDHDDEDPMKAYMIEEKRAEADVAIKKYEKEQRRHGSRRDGHHRHHHTSRGNSERHERRKRDKSDTRASQRDESEDRRDEVRRSRYRDHRERSGDDDRRPKHSRPQHRRRQSQSPTSDDGHSSRRHH